MKLAEALQERADLNRRLEQLRGRLTRNATVQEGEQPAEDPAVLLEEVETAAARLEELTAAVNKTNTAVRVEGKSLTELIARKDALALKLSLYRALLEEASDLTDRVSRKEIKVVSTVNVRELQKTADDMSRELRLTDNALQQANWTFDLI
ncbi:MAG: DIP1984 family protein [Oscillospiraceae bacterium]|nr:DIP1984 family protein [Oscillospiraceae bacterium]